jgi:lipoyl(octanoyl) transferase
MKQTSPIAPVWRPLAAPSSYDLAVSQMEAYAKTVVAGEAPEAVFITQHEAVYTAGTSAHDIDLLNPANIPTRRSGRGGQWTWHGPGQLVIWPVLNLNARQRDVRAYINALEGWMIDVLACFAVTGVRREGLPGIWVGRGDIGQPNRMDKIVAVGVRISKWVTMHGVALNHEPDLAQYEGIVPCGVRKVEGVKHARDGVGDSNVEAGGVTSLADLGLMITETELEIAVKDCFPKWFGTEAVMGLVGAIRQP